MNYFITFFDFTKKFHKKCPIEIFTPSKRKGLRLPTTYIKSLYYETGCGQTVLFWDILWHKNFVCMNCETYIALEYAHKPTWPTGFEKSEIHQPYLEKLQFSGSKIGAFLGNFSHFPSKSMTWYARYVEKQRHRQSSGMWYGRYVKFQRHKVQDCDMADM